MVYLCKKNIHCGNGISLGTVGIYQVLSAVEFIGGRKISWFFLKKYLLDIHKVTVSEIDIQPNTEEFFCQDREVKFI